MTRLDKNQLTRSTDISIYEETHKPEVNPDPDTSFSDFFGDVVIGLKSKEREKQEEEKAS